MIVTGIAHAPRRLNERTSLPSGEMVYLAKRALRLYRATRLITSLSPGWEQALAKAALELDLPITVAIPYPGRDQNWDRAARTSYLSLLTRADEVVRICDEPDEEAEMEGHRWRVDESDLVLSLWDYEFSGETYEVMTFALQTGKTVVNLWQDWDHLVKMRLRPAYQQPPAHHSRGAQVFDSQA